ncbi:MAG: hypothetical protein HY000_39435 [Planctomycetes bacterium]|nr:hypothetical protein [Planctomycetota bacterium]
MRSAPEHDKGTRRGGAVVVLVALLLVVFMVMVASAIDLGMVTLARTELQASADAAALAGAWELLDEDRLKGTPNLTTEIAAARQKAVDYAALNNVMGHGPVVDPNTPNDPNGDVVVGYLNDPSDQSESMSFANPTTYNSVQVDVRRSTVRNGPVSLFFGQVFGMSSVAVEASATAAFKDGVVGYKVTPETGNADLLPLALHVNSWINLLNGSVTVGDSYTYNSATKTVTAGPDGILELNIYPGAGGTQLPPGNLGTVDIGSQANSTSDLTRQILYGVNANDLSYFGGSLELGPDGTLPLNGETGLSAAIGNDLAAISGLPKGICLFNQVSGPGDNATFTIIGFAGIRVMNVKLTGSMNKKQVVIQPAFVVDDSAMTGPGSGSSYFVYQPVRLVR